jgi:hypothetical protein
MVEEKDKRDSMDKPTVTLPGTVEKIIPPVVPSQPEKAQIAVQGADDLYREIRVENTLTDPHGHEVKLKEGAPVEVTIEANREATVPKRSDAKEPTPASALPKKKLSAG